MSRWAFIKEDNVIDSLGVGLKAKPNHSDTQWPTRQWRRPSSPFVVLGPTKEDSQPCIIITVVVVVVVAVAVGGKSIWPETLKDWMCEFEYEAQSKQSTPARASTLVGRPRAPVWV
ncbi:hypothetical protein LX36DRAFT_396456 [Colletotrichum falcatum]|nr:hypothetical protein LX36DRAFT_396456 [Colletotrichum falcatum]